MAVRYVGADKLHLAFNFDFLRQPWRPRAFQRAILDYQARLPAEAQACYVLGNHDIARFPSRFGGGPHADARTKVAAAMLLTMRGTPFVYYGEEIGMQNTPIPRAEIQDPPGQRYWPLWGGRDPERTPMQWDGEVNAGFTTGQPWLRINSDYRQRNVVAQQSDPNSVLAFWKKLLRFRRASEALRRGDFKPLFAQPTEALAYLRQSPSQTVLVALNFYGWPVHLKLDEAPPDALWKLRLTSTPGGQYERVQGRHLALAPFEACLLEAVAQP
jgi:alpha-glucosidase